MRIAILARLGIASLTFSYAGAGIGQTEKVCAGPIPTGWIKVNDSFDPTSCGKPTVITYNVWTIERYDNKPVGAQLLACSAPAPPGWAVVNQAWNPTTCGHPSVNSSNVMTIKRLK